MSEPQGLAEILVAIAQVRDEIGHVAKDGTNAFHHYDYASEAAISRSVRPMLAKAGLVILQSVATEPAPRIDDCGVTHLVLEFTVAHTSGAVWPEKLLVFASGNDRDSKGLHGDKGAFKANTGGYKYFLNRLFMIDTGDDPEAGLQPPEFAPSGASESHPGRNADEFASEQQIRMLTARSYARAAEHEQEAKAFDGTVDYESRDAHAGAIRKAAKLVLGLDGAGTKVPSAAVTPMVRAIESTVLDADGKATIPHGEP